MMMRKLPLVVIALSVLAVGVLLWTPVPKVEAQFAGQAAFQVPFTVINKNTTIPPCILAAPTSTVPCIPNRNQLGHTITFAYSNLGSANAQFQLDGSNDNLNWTTLAQGNVQLNVPAAGMTYANGYFTYLRVKVQTGGGGTFKCVYTGYAVPIPINPMGDLVNDAFALKGPPVIPFNGLNPPFLLVGIHCYNPNASAAYLQIFKSTNQPTLGTAILTQFGIPTQQAFWYSGPPLMFDKNFWAGASTTSGGNVAVATGLACSFEMNGSGPFYPLTPVSP